jgi:hypothetical protein
VLFDKKDTVCDQDSFAPEVVNFALAVGRIGSETLDSGADVAVGKADDGYMEGRDTVEVRIEKVYHLKIKIAEIAGSVGGGLDLEVNFGTFVIERSQEANEGDDMGKGCLAKFAVEKGDGFDPEVGETEIDRDMMRLKGDFFIQRMVDPYDGT